VNRKRPAPNESGIASASASVDYLAVAEQVDEAAAEVCVEFISPIPNADLNSQNTRNEKRLLLLYNKTFQVCSILSSQLPHKSSLWMSNANMVLDDRFESTMDRFLTHIKSFEWSNKNRTWPKTLRERRISKTTMGFQLESESSSSPELQPESLQLHEDSEMEDSLEG
jgi:hypothetical protein